MSETKLPSARAMTIVQDALPIMDTARFDHMQRIATSIAAGSLVPKHLVVQNHVVATVANCFRVVNQAFRWGLDPFAIIDETYAVGQKLGYSGKLVAGVINTKAGLKQRLSYTYNDKPGDDLTITVHGTFVGEEAERTITVRVGDVKTSNGMWVKDPRQKLIYTGATKWARAHAPEIILGVVTDDDIERMKDMGDLVEVGGNTYVPAGDVPPRPSRAAAPAKPEPFSLMDVDGIITDYDSADKADTEFRAMLERTVSLGPDTLEGLWDSNGLFLTQLRERGHEQTADLIGAYYVETMKVADSKKRQATPAAETKKADGQATKQIAPANTEKKVEEAEPQSPLANKKAEWAPWVDWAIRRIAALPKPELARFLLTREIEFIRENRLPDMDRINIALDERRDG